MTIQELTQKYKNVPQELKIMKRWVCFKVEGMENGKTTKRPYNAISGKFAKVNDSLTWSTFSIAINGCTKYNFDGLGFVLGDGIFGIDLDNHIKETGELEVPKAEFDSLCEEFITTLDSYTETSQSGNGIHIICAGKLPEGARRHSGIEMYDKSRFFAFTGNAVRNIPISNREEEVKKLWDKYLNINVEQPKVINNNIQKAVLLSDEDIINTALNSQQGGVFYKYWHDGDISLNNNDASSADMSFANMLAFWCNGNYSQMDRIFRNSALMRDKWDEYRGDKTYGQKTLETAISRMINGYIPVEKTTVSIKDKDLSKYVEKANKEKYEMNIDETGEPIFHIKKIYKHYPYSDTGNAMRFYDYFGDLFRYNVTDKVFMFWTGKTWIKDVTNIIRKYANRFIGILKDEAEILIEEIGDDRKAGKIEEAALKEKLLDACQKNIGRVGNKAGKDAMLSELQSIGEIPIESCEFNKDDYLLNTDSGIVNLLTGEISPFDKTKLISKNTNTKVSFDIPETWISFLQSVFNTGNIAETQEIVDALQVAVGYSLSGSTKEQVMFLLHGQGSNGKSTLTETISNILGDYSDTIASSVLMQQKTQNNAAMYSIAKLQTTRFVETGETDDGGRLAEAQLKILTGSDMISAQFKYGNEFSFKPKFKIWMSTNNMPNIVGTDLGIWRRIFIFPFVNTFTGAQKDKNLPDKLKEEKEKILGWCIKGFLKYQEIGDLLQPRRLKDAVDQHKEKMNNVAQFVKSECSLGEKCVIECNQLYQAYKEWVNNNADFLYKESKFADKLREDSNIVRRKNAQGKNVYVGIRLAGSFSIGNL